MSNAMIEHEAVVHSIDGNKLTVAMATGGCSSCGQCGMARIAGNRPATLLTLPLSGNYKVGDVVNVGLPESGMPLTALLGYLFPAVAVLIGAIFGSLIDGSDAATAVGAIAGFLIAMVITRTVIWLLPNLMPTPQLLPLATHSALSQQEFHHER